MSFREWLVCFENVNLPIGMLAKTVGLMSPLLYDYDSIRRMLIGMSASRSTILLLALCNTLYETGNYTAAEMP